MINVHHNRRAGAFTLLEVVVAMVVVLIAMMGSTHPYQGNLRFRHNDQTQCNVLFSDGSVRQFTAVVNADLTGSSHDALRRYFMIHYPPGVTPNPSMPH